jgi:hypothetical protein
MAAMSEVIRWYVQCGSAGIAPNPSFDNEADAIARFHEEKAIHSYFGKGHQRQASIVKITTITEDVTPGRAALAQPTSAVEGEVVPVAYLSEGNMNLLKVGSGGAYNVQISNVKFSRFTVPLYADPVAAPVSREWLVRAERKLSAYVGVCKGDKELTDTILPALRSLIEGEKP